MVRKIIHQTWKTPDVPNDVYPNVWQRTWVDQHPGWEYKLWTDADNDSLVRSCYPHFAKAYESLPSGVVKSDVARALILHREGGMYADLDFVCLRSFTPLIESVGQCLMVGRHDQRAQPLPNAWMYSPQGHPLWIHLVTDALDDWTNGRRSKTEEIAGPDRLAWCLSKYDPDRIELPPGVVYPFVWGNTQSTEKALSLDWANIRELTNAYSPSLAVTRWCHNW